MADSDEKPKEPPAEQPKPVEKPSAPPDWQGVRGGIKPGDLQRKGS